MALSNELSSEIATALLTVKDRSPRELEKLKETVLLVHSTLQNLSDEARAKRSKSATADKHTAAER